MDILEPAHVGGQAIPAFPTLAAHSQRPIQHGPTTGVGLNPPQRHNLDLASTTPQQMIVAADRGSAVSALM